MILHLYFGSISIIPLKISIILKMFKVHTQVLKVSRMLNLFPVFVQENVIK